jgi:23S rRNA pseudouridine1911/1915/1917 synthase
MVVAKNDESHQRLAKQFSGREVHKTYMALVHGWPKQDRGTIQSAISRHSQRRTRMTTRGFGGREAVTHYVVLTKDRFALRQVCARRTQDRDRTHAPDSRAYVVAGTSGGGRRALWRAGRIAVAVEQAPRAAGMPATLTLDRNFLHSATLELTHPRTKEALKFSRPLPAELETFTR